MSPFAKPSTLPENRSAPPGVFIPVLPYPEVGAAVKWLCEGFGFVERLRIGDHRAQLVFGGGSMVVSGSPNPVIGNQSIMVRVAEIDQHFERARKQAGAKIIQPPTDFPYGERQYIAEDFAGYRWVFSQSIADVHPQDWGGILRDDPRSGVESA